MPRVRKQSMDMRRRDARERAKNRRAARTPSEVAVERAVRAQQTRDRRANMTPEERARIAYRMMMVARKRRHNLTPEARTLWLERHAEYQRARRARLSVQEQAQIRHINAERARTRRANLSEQQLADIRRSNAERARARRAMLASRQNVQIQPCLGVTQSFITEQPTRPRVGETQQVLGFSNAPSDFFMHIGLQKQHQDALHISGFSLNQALSVPPNMCGQMPFTNICRQTPFPNVYEQSPFTNMYAQSHFRNHEQVPNWMAMDREPTPDVGLTSENNDVNLLPLVNVNVEIVEGTGEVNVTGLEDSEVKDAISENIDGPEVGTAEGIQDRMKSEMKAEDELPVKSYPIGTTQSIKHEMKMKERISTEQIHQIIQRDVKSEFQIKEEDFSEPLLHTSISKDRERHTERSRRLQSSTTDSHSFSKGAIRNEIQDCILGSGFTAINREKYDRSACKILGAISKDELVDSSNIAEVTLSKTKCRKSQLCVQAMTSGKRLDCKNRPGNKCTISLRNASSYCDFEVSLDSMYKRQVCWTDSDLSQVNRFGTAVQYEDSSVPGVVLQDGVVRACDNVVTSFRDKKNSFRTGSDFTQTFSLSENKVKCENITVNDKTYPQKCEVNSYRLEKDSPGFRNERVIGSDMAPEGTSGNIGEPKNRSAREVHSLQNSVVGSQTVAVLSRNEKGQKCRGKSDFTATVTSGSALSTKDMYINETTLFQNNSVNPYKFEKVTICPQGERR